jgi:hypothetical protein
MRGMARHGHVAVAVIRVRLPSDDAPASARLLTCTEALDPSWATQTAADKERLLLQLSAWLDQVWEAAYDGS